MFRMSTTYLHLVLLPALGPLVYYCLAIYSGWIYFKRMERFSPPKSEAKHSLLVINDSDVRVEKDYLKQILASFSDPKVGLVTALFRSKAGDGFAERLDAIGVGCRPTQRPACFYSGDSRKSISPMAGKYIFSKRHGECPQCGSHLVKRCQRKGFVEVVVFRVLYLWPFLCNECNARYFDYIRSIEQSKQPLS
jgi:hypothetical protein